MMLNALNKVTRFNHTVGVTTKLNFCDYLNADLNSKYSNILICVCLCVCVCGLNPNCLRKHFYALVESITDVVALSEVWMSGSGVYTVDF